MLRAISDVSGMSNIFTVGSKAREGTILSKAKHTHGRSQLKGRSPVSVMLQKTAGALKPLEMDYGDLR